jgi:ABC-type antimicrobial peptide transport system permease subunit
MQSEGSLRSVVRELDPQLALSDLETIGSGIARSLATRKLVSWVLGFFGAVASVLALVGIYGVISFVTSQRRRELGIRVAIGATRLGIMKMMLLEGGGLVAGGLLCGWMVYLACSRWLSSIVFDISTGDVATLVVCGAVLAISALLAISMPVWRGASQDPASVLRS